MAVPTPPGPRVSLVPLSPSLRLLVRVGHELAFKCLFVKSENKATQRLTEFAPCPLGTEAGLELEFQLLPLSLLSPQRVTCE